MNNPEPIRCPKCGFWIIYQPSGYWTHWGERITIWDLVEAISAAKEAEK